MKRALAGFLFSCLVVASEPLRAADAVTLAAQQEVIENFKRLTATVEELQTTQAAQQKQISALSSELSKLREELSRNNGDAANKESIRKLSEQVVKVDEARIADNKRIQDALEKLGEVIKKAPVTVRPVKPLTDTTVNGAGTSVKINPKGATPPPSGDEVGFPYEVVSGDHPERIAAKFRAENVNVTAKSIIAANPNVDWTKLKVGQKLFIPKPKA